MHSAHSCMQQKLVHSKLAHAVGDMHGLFPFFSDTMKLYYHPLYNSTTATPLSLCLLSPALEPVRHLLVLHYCLQCLYVLLVAISVAAKVWF